MTQLNSPEFSATASSVSTGSRYAGGLECQRVFRLLPSVVRTAPWTPRSLLVVAPQPSLSCINSQAFKPTSRQREALVSLDCAVAEARPLVWTRRHLLDLEDLGRSEIETILNTAADFVEASQHRRTKTTDLRGRVVVNLFFEPSTRTRTSFAVAARRLERGYDRLCGPGSSVSKGETFIDTAKNIEAMGVDIMVVRHASPGARICSPSTCTAGSSTPATAPMSTRLRVCSTFSRSARSRAASRDSTVGLVGDIAHSRVARSNIHGLLKLGAQRDRLRTVRRWCRIRFGQLGVEVAYRLDDILPVCDVINVLRIQFERQRSGLFPSIHEYARLFGMDSVRLGRAKPGLLLLAPGPINRGVEVTPEVADGPHSAILQQVTNGPAVRMAVLCLLCRAATEECP